MVKVATEWSSNPSSETNEYAYDSATHNYDSSTRNYDGVVDTDMSDRESTPAAWTKQSKTPAAWTKGSKTPTDWEAA